MTTKASCATEVLTVPELARLLRVNAKTVYRLVRANRIPGVHRVGRLVRIHREAALRWLAADVR